MDRREFFKGMFGVAIVAAIPKQVMDQMVEVPIEEITPVLEKPKHIVYQLDKQCMFLFNNSELIAGSTLFSLDYKRELVPIPSWNEFDQYRLGLPEWRVSVQHLRWFNHETGWHYLTENKPLHCVLYDGNNILKGDVYITECLLTCPIMNDIQEDVILTGTGALIINKNESDPNIP